MKHGPVDVIIPCYNEADRLPVKEFTGFLASAPDFHFLFVDDGSTDRTAEVIGQIVSAHPERASLLKLEINSGKAEAVRRGVLKAFDKCRADYIAYWDADLATPLDALKDFMSVFPQCPDLDFVIGSRVQLLGRRIVRQKTRHYLGRVFATFASFVLGIPIYDTQCGAKMFRHKPEIHELFKEPFQSKWIFDVELLARYLKDAKPNRLETAERRICELPLKVWLDVKGSKVTSGDFLKAILELTQVYFRYS